jgi:hypothetical protein
MATSPRRQGNIYFLNIFKRFVSMNCFTAVAIMVTVHVPEMARYTIGPLPVVWCRMKTLFEMSAITSIVVTLDAAVVARHAYIFWLKNPASFHDEFWDQCYSTD